MITTTIDQGLLCASKVSSMHFFVRLYESRYYLQIRKLHSSRSEVICPRISECLAREEGISFHSFNTKAPGLVKMENPNKMKESVILILFGLANSAVYLQ